MKVKIEIEIEISDQNEFSNDDLQTYFHSTIDETFSNPDPIIKIEKLQTKIEIL